MQVIGFNLSKVLAERSPDFTRSAINTNIEFSNVEKEKVDLLKDAEAVKISFKFSVIYEDREKKEKKNGEVSCEGVIVLSTSKEEAKDFHKSWKKKEVPKDTMIPLYNVILKKCSLKALQLEDDLNLPPHIPFPQIRAQPNQDN